MTLLSVAPTRSATAPPMAPSTALSTTSCAVDATRRGQLEAAQDPRVFSLEGDLGDFGGDAFSRAHPDRFLDLGIAEANLIGVAAGLAARGKIPFVNTFAAFALMRACEQVRLDVAFHASNVKIVGTFTGLAAGFSGPTHHCTEDLAIARVMPNLAVLAPADAHAAYQLTLRAAEWLGPVYLRIGLDATPDVYPESASFHVGGSTVLREGSDVTILAAGLAAVPAAVEAAQQLEALGVDAAVLDVYSLKPMDHASILEWSRRSGLVVTVEEHGVHGGLGNAVAELLMECHPIPVVCTSTPDRFATEMASHADHLSHAGIDAAGVCGTVLGALERWKP